MFSYCYHGSVDETFVINGPTGTTVSRPGNVAPAVDPATTTVAVEFNDLEAVARELRTRQIAAVLTEPALTNIGIVLPSEGFLDGLRNICDETGTLLMIDETHTFSVGTGGATKAWGLSPDIVTIGKSIAGGIPMGAFGLSSRLADSILTSHKLPWSVTRLGARSEYRFCSPAPVSGSQSRKSEDVELNEYFHLFMNNRGVLITPFHNMVLICPKTTIADVDLHCQHFDEALDGLLE